MKHYIVEYFILDEDFIRTVVLALADKFIMIEKLHMCIKNTCILVINGHVHLHGIHCHSIHVM